MPFTYQYAHAALTSTVVVFAYDEHGNYWTPFIKRKEEPFKDEWALPGGFWDLINNEDGKRAAKRELFEETGIRVNDVEFVLLRDAADRDPRERVIDVVYMTICKKQDLVPKDDAEDAAWFPFEDVPFLAFDHFSSYQAAVQKLKNKRPR